MSTMAQAVPASTRSVWTGRILGAILALILLVDSLKKIAKASFVLQAMAQTGHPVRLAPTFRWILFICIIFYVIPRTSILGAILLTGYLGGATEANLPAGFPVFMTLIPVVFGILIWGALYLRDARLRSLIPFKGNEETGSAFEFNFKRRASNETGN